jgi:RimJ/RimL family protein N-acetyltransferase
MPQLEGYPECGWAFVPRAWGKGLATESLRAILKWSDGALPTSEIRCIVEPRNTASIRVAEKCGFDRLGTLTSDLGESILFGRPPRAS